MSLLLYAALSLPVVFAGGFFLLDRWIMRMYGFKRTMAKTNPKSIGLHYEDVYFPTVRNLTIHGWFVPAPPTDPSETTTTTTAAAAAAEAAATKRPTVVLTHGYSQNAEYLMPLVPIFHKNGFHCLLIEARGHGESSGDGLMNLLKFSEDIRSAIDYLVSSPARSTVVDQNRIGLVGFSMGGAGAVHAASIDERIKFLITMGAFARYQKVLRDDWRKAGFKFEWMIDVLMYMVRRRVPFDMDKLSPINTIQAIKRDRPVLIVHGTLDGGVKYEEAVLLDKMNPSLKKAFITVEGAKHLNLMRFDQVIHGIEEYVSQTILQSLYPGGGGAPDVVVARPLAG